MVVRTGADGGVVCVAGSVECGSLVSDQLLFFNRFAPRIALPTVSSTPRQRGLDSHVHDLLASPVNRGVSLQCRSVLDPAVFPQLAALTHGQCLEPLYQYVHWETEGDLNLSTDEGEKFRSAYAVLGCLSSLPVIPHHIRPTNAVLALQPHLSDGYVELPALVVSPLPFSTTLPDTAISTSTVLRSSPSSSLSASSPSRPSPALLSFTSGGCDVFIECIVPYLDTNSLLFGLLPAVHSLAAFTAALTSSSYGRRVLVARYSTFSDAALWSNELLSALRDEGFNQQRVEGNREAEAKSEVINNTISNKKSEQIDIEENRAHRHEMHWAAAFDLQARINKYLIRVMLQRKEDILPQLYQPPPVAAPHSLPASSDAQPSTPGTVRPVYRTVPDAAMELLLCVPPFFPLPRRVGSGHQLHSIALAEEYSLGGRTVSNPSPHRTDFAAFMRSTDEDIIRSTWSLYMGPVYVYENKHTADRGWVVPNAEPCRALWEAPRYRLVEKVESTVRLTYIDDVNQLPVVRRLVRGAGFPADYSSAHNELHLFTATLADCFKVRGVTALIERTRLQWRKIAIKCAAMASERQQQQTAMECDEYKAERDRSKEEIAGQPTAEECDGVEEEEDLRPYVHVENEDDISWRRIMSSGCGSIYASHLMTPLLHSLHTTMRKHPISR